MESKTFVVYADEPNDVRVLTRAFSVNTSYLPTYFFKFSNMCRNIAAQRAHVSALTPISLVGKFGFFW